LNSLPWVDDTGYVNINWVKRCRVWWRRLHKSDVQKGLTISAAEAVVCAAMIAAFDNWVVPVLQLRLHASPYFTGIMIQLPMICLAATGPFAGALIRAFGGDKRVAVWSGLIQALCLCVFIIPISCSDKPWSLPLAAICLFGFGLAGAFNVTAWMSWMSNLIPPMIRGKYWSNRFQAMLLTKLVFALLFSLIIKALPITTQVAGITAVFVIATISRLLSASLLWIQPYRAAPPPAKPMSTRFLHPGGLWHFVRTSHRTDLGRWTLVWSLLAFGLGAAGPYFQIYMLSDSPIGLGLSASPITFTLLSQMNFIVKFLSLTFIGRMIDRLGAKPVLRIAVISTALLPLTWACTQSIPVLLLNEIAAGFAWGMVDCSTGVLLLTCGTSENRARLIAFHQTISAFAVVAGTAFGGFLLTRLPELDGSLFRSLFVLSVILRVPAVILAIAFLPAHPALRLRAGMWRAIPNLLSRGYAHFFRG
jgi:MFS family permease